MQAVYQLRFPLLYSFAVYEMLVLLIGLLTSIRGLQLPRPRVMNILLFTLIWAPAVMLWSAAFAQHVVIQTTFILLVTTGISVISSRWPLYHSLFAAGFITAGSIIVDGLTGGVLIQHSVLGYDPMIGARYYGIGNEYMGVLIGAAVLMCAAGMQFVSVRRRGKQGGLQGEAGSVYVPELAQPDADPGVQKQVSAEMKACFYAVLILFALLTFYMIHPRLGTNFGGSVTAAAAGGWLALRLYEHIFRKRVLMKKLMLYVGSIALFVAAAIVAVHMFQAEGQASHIGKAIRMLADKEYDMLWGIIVRKLQMNWHLVNVSSWSKVFITGLFILSAGLLRPSGMFKTWHMHRPLLSVGFSAIALGAIVAFIFNDSGVVAAATMIIYAVAPMLLLTQRLADKTESVAE